MDYIEFKKAFQEIGEGERSKEYFEIIEKSSPKILVLIDSFNKLLLDNPDLTFNSDLGNFTYHPFYLYGGKSLYHKIDIILEPIRKQKIIVQYILFKMLLRRWENINFDFLPAVELIEVELFDLETKLNQEPLKPPTLNPAAEKVEFKHFSESFNFISDWQEIKTQLIERKFLSESGKWIDFGNGYKTTAAGLIKWVAANGYCQKTKFTWQEIQSFCIDDFGIDEISERTIKTNTQDIPELYWLHPKT